ncbi:hypothetical protein EPN29_13580 [bacterium]|nr:MAG: hypothetical protein EPN29_13580 [bacterium]
MPRSSRRRRAALNRETSEAADRRNLFLVLARRLPDDRDLPVPTKQEAEARRVTTLGEFRSLLRSWDWETAIEAWLTFKIDNPNTRDHYGRNMRRAAAVFRASRPAARCLGELQPEHVMVYARYVRDRLGGAPGTKRLAIMALRSFLKWSRAFRAHDLSPEELRELLGRVPSADVERPYLVLSEDEIADLLAAPDNTRDRAIIALMLGAGLRRSEVVGLEGKDVFYGEDGCLCLNIHAGIAKGAQPRIVPLGPDVTQILLEHLVAAGVEVGDRLPIFQSSHKHRGRRLSGKAAWSIVTTYVVSLGWQKRVTPHSLRHTFALRFLRHAKGVGGDAIVKLMLVLGHKHLSTTQRYLNHFDREELRLALPALPTSGRPLKRKLPQSVVNQRRRRTIKPDLPESA